MSTSESKSGGKNAATGAPLNKYEEARNAKKKSRRRAHRKTIKRPNTNG